MNSSASSVEAAVRFSNVTAAALLAKRAPTSTQQMENSLAAGDEGLITGSWGFPVEGVGRAEMCAVKRRLRAAVGTATRPPFRSSRKPPKHFANPAGPATAPALADDYERDATFESTTRCEKGTRMGHASQNAGRSIVRTVLGHGAGRSASSAPAPWIQNEKPVQRYNVLSRPQLTCCAGVAPHRLAVPGEGAHPVPMGGVLPV